MILVMVATFLYQVSVMSVNPLINGYAHHLGASATFAGVIVGIMSVVSMLLRPVAGNLTDRLSKYQLTMTGGVLCSVGNIGYLISPNPIWLLVFRLINGTGFVLCTVCMATWLAFLVPRNHVGEAMGYYGLLNATSMALAPALSISLYQVIGYRATLCMSAMAGILMVVIIQFISNHAKPVTEVKKAPHQFKLLQHDALPVAVIVSLLSIPYFITQADIVQYVEQQHLHVAVNLYFLIYAVVLFAIRIMLKDYFDTIRFSIWFIICSIATIVYIIFLTIMQANWEMALAAAGMALGYGIMFSICQSTSLLLAPESEQGLASSTFYLGLDIGMAIGPIIGGIINDILSIHYLYPPMLAIVPIALIIFLKYRRKLDSAVQHH